MIGTVTIPQGRRVLIWNTRGEARTVDGPQRFFVFGEEVQNLARFAAEPDQYLVIKRLDGRTEHIPGPTTVWFNPLEHTVITVETAVKVDANEALVVYRRLPAPATVQRRVVRGPALFVPMAEEWVHHFSWHGSDPKAGNRKVPHAVQFEKLRVIPDQIYFDVQNVRTGDDALLAIKLMVFFELCDIERMLDQTHDPIADFINALSADVIDFVGAFDFNTFKTKTDALNDLGTYVQLLQRAEKIGYCISKVVYRGYYASDKLQTMHDSAIECRTKLGLEAETERQAQELADLKLVREQERLIREQEMDETQTRHELKLAQLKHQAQLEQKQTLMEQELEAKRRENALAVETRKNQFAVEREHEQALHEEQSGYYARMRDLNVDLTRYLVAQYQNPDKIIRIDGQRQPQLHLHEDEGTS